MPGYARPTNILTAQEIVVTPTGDISSTNLQAALTEISSEKATMSSLTAVSSSVITIQNNLNITSSNLANEISSANSLALLLSNS